MIADQEYDAFRAMFLAEFARLAEQAGRYISRMDNDDRELVLATALHLAWVNRRDFRPRRHQLLIYWDDALRAALKQQATWSLRHLSGWHVFTHEEMLALIAPVGKPHE